MNKPRYFSLEELIRSDTAVSKKIPNLPTWDIIDNLNRLALYQRKSQISLPGI